MKQVSFNGKGDSGSPETPQWHSWRLAGIGGSDAVILAAQEGLVKAPSWAQTAQWLWEVKTGRRAPDNLDNNPAIIRGKKGEPLARKRFIKETGIEVKPVFGEHDGHSFIRASFDGMDLTRKNLCEIKVPSLSSHQLAKQGIVPEYYLPQMAHQSLVTWGHPDNFTGNMYYVSYHPETDDIAIVDTISSGGFQVPLVECLKPLAEKLILIESNFWSTVINDVLPCGTEWVVAAHEWLSFDYEIKRLEEKQNDVKERLIDLISNKTKESGGGISMSKQNKKGSIDYTKLIEDLLPSLSEAELEKYRKPAGSETFTIRRQEKLI